MKKPKVKAIIFDLGGVVVHGGYLNFINHYCRGGLSSTGHKRIASLEHMLNQGKISEDEFYLRIQKAFNVHLKPKQMHNMIVSHMQANKSLAKFIPHLKPAKVALFTNSLGTITSEVLSKKKMSVKKLFDKVFLSQVIHLAKPDKRAYSYVIRHLKVKPSESLMVDDRLENIKAAKKLGMQGIVFKNTTQFKKELSKYELV
jgi:epoxide hydrolase-like predicted phosphatase